MKKPRVDIEAFSSRTGMSYADIARAAGISKPMVTCIRKGTSTPSYSTLAAFHGLGMTPSEMFGEDSGAKISDADCEKIAEFVYFRMSGKKRE